MKYFGAFSCREDVVREFSAYDRETVKGIPSDRNILIASYYDENYEGDAYVLFKRGKKLYEVRGGHCSCFGLEDQWVPEETTWEFLGSEKVYIPSGISSYEEATNYFKKLIQENLGK